MPGPDKPHDDVPAGYRVAKNTCLDRPFWEFYDRTGEAGRCAYEDREAAVRGAREHFERRPVFKHQRSFFSHPDLTASHGSHLAHGSTAQRDFYREVAASLQAVEGREPLAERKPVVIIESRYAGNVERNTAYARLALADALGRGEAPFASHLLYTQIGVLDDSDPVERQRGMEAGWEFMRDADLVAVYVDLGISDGMKQGIAEAERRGLEVVFREIPDWRARLRRGRPNAPVFHSGGFLDRAKRGRHGLQDDEVPAIITKSRAATLAEAVRSSSIRQRPIAEALARLDKIETFPSYEERWPWWRRLFRVWTGTEEEWLEQHEADRLSFYAMQKALNP